MSHHQSTAELIIGAVLIGGITIFALAIGAGAQKRLDDPNDATAVDLADLPNLVALEHYGTYRVTILRQSRNLSSEQIVTGTPRAALAAALSTFRRAGISTISVHQNTACELEFSRLFYSYGGRASGKKIGRAIITLVSATPRPQATVEPVTDAVPHVSLFVAATCDCGHKTPLSLIDFERGAICSSCGDDITPSPEQIARIRTDAFTASARVKAGEAAGLPAEQILKRVQEGRARDRGSFS